MAVQSFTSRADPIPINGVILEIDGGYDTALKVEVSTATEGSGDGAKVESRAIPKTRRESRRIGLIADPGEFDYYYLKVLQKNGQVAWSSPIRFG